MTRQGLSQRRISKKGHALYSGIKVRHEFGTGFLVHKQAVDRIISFTSVNERICFIRIICWFRKISIINACISTLDKSDEIKKEFYAQLKKEYDRASRYDVKIIMRDFIAKVRQELFLKPSIGLHPWFDKQ